MLLGETCNPVLSSVGLRRIPFCCQEPASQLPLNFSVDDSLSERIWQAATLLASRGSHILSRTTRRLQ